MSSREEIYQRYDVDDKWTGFNDTASKKLKTLHIMPALFKRKPGKSSKSKDHIKSFERKLYV